MKLVDVAARNQKEVDKIVKNIKALIKKNGIHIGHFEVTNKGLIYTISVESNNSGMKYGLGSDIKDIINKSDTATVIEVNEYPGSFDWQSDTYIKDCSVVTFKF